MIEKKEKARTGSKKTSMNRARINKENRERGDQLEDLIEWLLSGSRQSGSGSGCIEREDLKADGLLIQAKGTNGKSISVKLADIEKLILHAEEDSLDPAFVFGFERRGKFIPSRTFIAVPISVWMKKK